MWDRLICSPRTAAIFLMAVAVSGKVAGANDFSVGAVKDATRLVVMLESKFSEGDRVGAGLVVGVQGRSLFIATANHNVRWGTSTASQVGIRLRTAPDVLLHATLLPTFDPKLDLTFLRVDDVGAEQAQLPLHRVGDVSTLKSGDSVYPMGNGTRPWALGQYPDSFEEGDGDLLSFQSDFIRPGQSGGALWNDALELVGMIRADQPPDGVAVAISTVLARARSWNIPVSLTPELSNVPFTSVSVGSSHACALAATGELYCFGENQGKLGDGTEANSSRPRKVLGEQLFAEASVGRDMSCALDRQGNAWCWGSDVFNELGIATREQHDSYMQRVPSQVAGGHRFKSISSLGVPYSCALEVNGLAWCWGDSDRRMVGPHRSGGDIEYASMSVGEQGACGLTPDGRTFCWNLNPNRDAPLNEPTALVGAPRFTTIAVGGDYRLTGCGLTQMLAAYCWGYNDEGQLGDGKGTSSHTSANDSPSPVPVAGALKFRSLSVGTNHACGVTSSGKAWCWGGNQDGQLGDGTTQNRALPTPVAGDLAFAQISAGNHRTCGVSAAHVLLCWGKVGEEVVIHPVRVAGQRQSSSDR